MDQGISPVTILEIEEALSQVAEIRAARIVSSDEGVIQEIHVLALPSKSPKQLVRDIESTIMAQFGITIDHKKVSIAQLGRESVQMADEVTGAPTGPPRATRPLRSPAPRGRGSTPSTPRSSACVRCPPWSWTSGASSTPEWPRAPRRQRAGCDW
jgi:hypothetical protein